MFYLGQINNVQNVILQLPKKNLYLQKPLVEHAKLVIANVGLRGDDEPI